MTPRLLQQEISQRILGLGQDRKAVFCILGPNGCGKSDVLDAVLNEARNENVPALYLDFRQCDERSEDGFFSWIFTQFKEQGWLGLEKRRSARLDFVKTLLEIPRKFSSSALLAIDHLDCLPDGNARAFVSDLREYQEQVDRSCSRRVVCVVAGCVSMMDLKKRANSPNLQFDYVTLPVWDTTTTVDSSADFISKLGFTFEKRAMSLLADYTGGESTFLRMLMPHIEGKILDEEAIESGVRILVAHAVDCPYLMHLAGLYSFDRELQRCVDLLLNKRAVHFRDTHGIFRDIDTHQLRGALVAEPIAPYRYRFRNGIVRTFFEHLNLRRRGLLQNDTSGHDHQSSNKTIWSISQWPNVRDWLDELRTAWEVLVGTVDNLDLEFGRSLTTSSDAPFVAVQPNTSCWIDNSGEHPLIVSSVELLGTWSIQVKITAGAEFLATVRARYALEAWLSYFGSIANVGLLLHFAELGQSTVDHFERYSSSNQKNKVFIVHGRDIASRDAIFAFLRELKLNPLGWREAKQLTGKPTPSVFEVIDAGMRNAQACIVLMTGDDEVRLRSKYRTKADRASESKLTPQARPNVLFEAGMALGRYERRTILVQFGKVRPFSDVAGLSIIEHDSNPRFRKDLIAALQVAECKMETKDPAKPARGSA